MKGAELATAAGVDHLTITVSASPAYSEKNVHMTLDEARTQVEAIRAAAPAAVLDEVISCAFGSPFPGEDITPDDVAVFVDHARAVGVDHVTLADTTGVGTPRRVGAVLDRVGTDVGLHLHDTRGTALLNAWTAIDRGVTRFDTAARRARRLTVRPRRRRQPRHRGPGQRARTTPASTPASTSTRCSRSGPCSPTSSATACPAASPRPSPESDGVLSFGIGRFASIPNDRTEIQMATFG